MEISQIIPGGTRYGHEFQCIGCDRHVIAFVHHGHARLCLMCQELGPEMSRAIQDRGEAIPPVENLPLTPRHEARLARSEADHRAWVARSP
jgi:hypothetical protein